MFTQSAWESNDKTWASWKTLSTMCKQQWPLKNKNDELRLNSFQNPWLESILIRFNCLRLYFDILPHGSHYLEKVLKCSSCREKFLNSVKVLKKYLISLLGLEKFLKFTTLSKNIFEHEQYLSFVSLFLMLFLYLRCNCKSYPVIFQSFVVESSIK